MIYLAVSSLCVSLKFKDAQIVQYFGSLESIIKKLQMPKGGS